MGRKCTALSEKYLGRKPSQNETYDRAQLACLLHYFDNPSVRQYLLSGMFEKYFWCSHDYIQEERVTKPCGRITAFCHLNGFVVGISVNLLTCLSFYVKENHCLQIDKGGHYEIKFSRKNVFAKNIFFFQLHEAKRTPHKNAMLLFNHLLQLWH